MDFRNISLLVFHEPNFVFNSEAGEVGIYFGHYVCREIYSFIDLKQSFRTELMMPSYLNFVVVS